MTEMMRIIDEQGRIATPLLTPYPNDEDKYGVADYLVKEYKLHYAFTAVIYGLHTLGHLGFDRLDIPEDADLSGLLYIVLGLCRAVESDTFKDAMEVLEKQNEEFSKDTKFFIAEALQWLAYLVETDLSRFDRAECLYEEAIGILRESAGHSIGLIIYGLELMQKSYLIEKIDLLVILGCQESYLREHMKMEKAD